MSPDPVRVYRVATVTAPVGWTGTETLTFTATDPGGLSGHDVMAVTATG